MTEYQIQSSTRRCARTGREISPGERYYSVLIDEGGAFARQDYSLEGWKGPPEGAFSHWLGRLSAEAYGLLYDSDSRIVPDPDRGVQAAVRCVFHTFAAAGSAWMTVCLLSQSAVRRTAPSLANLRRSSRKDAQIARRALCCESSSQHLLSR